MAAHQTNKHSKAIALAPENTPGIQAPPRRVPDFNGPRQNVTLPQQKQPSPNHTTTDSGTQGCSVSAVFIGQTGLSGRAVRRESIRPRSSTMGDHGGKIDPPDVVPDEHLTRDLIAEMYKGMK